jgi:hypothetical protein
MRSQWPSAVIGTKLSNIPQSSRRPLKNSSGMIDLSALRPFPKMRDAHSRAQIKQIAKSIETFGFTNPTWPVTNSRPLWVTGAPPLCVWNKSNTGMGSYYRSKHELIFVSKKPTAGIVRTSKDDVGPCPKQ